MSDSGGGDNSPKTVNCALGTEFDLEPGATEDVCVDLDGEWREESAVTRHPDLDIPGLELVTGAVGEGGDHVNITFKNSSDGKITIDKDRVAITIKEPGPDVQTVGNEEKTVSKDTEAEEEKMDTEDSVVTKVSPEAEETPSKDRDNEETSGEVMEVDGGSSENSENKPQSAEKAKDTAFDSLFQDSSKPTVETSKDTDTTDDAPETAEVEKSSKDTDTTDDAPETADVEKKDNGEDKPDGEKKLSSPVLKMSFVDESVSTEQEKNDAGLENGENDKEDSKKMDTDSDTTDKKAEESDKNVDPSAEKRDVNNDEKKDESSEEKKSSDETDKDKPTLKLASFSTMTSPENGHSEENEDGCYSCAKLITNLYEAIVWETMQFCDEVIKIIKVGESKNPLYLLELSSQVSSWHVEMRLLQQRSTSCQSW